MKYCRNRPEGLAHRTKLRCEVLPHLRLGMMVPEATVLSLLLGISSSEAARHMRRVLDESGILTETRNYGEGKRAVIAFIPENLHPTRMVRAPSGLSYQHYEGML